MTDQVPRMTEEEKEKYVAQWEREYKRKWREAHKEKIKEYKRQWGKEHREHIREYQRKWRAEHPEQARENTRRGWKAWAERKAMAELAVKEAGETRGQ